MLQKKREFIVWKSPTSSDLLHNGQLIKPFQNWFFVKSGDAALTRRIKQNGEYWVQCQHRRNRIENIGVWCDKTLVEELTDKLIQERENPQYQKRLESGKRYREKKQKLYQQEFYLAVLNFLNFDKKWKNLAIIFAQVVTDHTIPVGSGTVARTQTLSLEKKAEAAVIAWMRHQTTAYEELKIAKVKGRRREVRHSLAESSRKILDNYRKNNLDYNYSQCPLFLALHKKDK